MARTAQEGLDFPIGTYIQQPPANFNGLATGIDPRNYINSWPPEHRLIHQPLPFPFSKNQGQNYGYNRPALASRINISGRRPAAAKSVSAIPSPSPSSSQFWTVASRPKQKMPGRPLKRSAGSSDDGQASRDIPAKVKLPRLDRGQDFSSVVKNRLQSYTRTGQACDRCKVCGDPSQMFGELIANLFVPSRFARSDATLFLRAVPTVRARTSNASSPIASRAGPSEEDTCRRWKERRKMLCPTSGVSKSCSAKLGSRFSHGSGLQSRNALLESPLTAMTILSKIPSSKTTGHGGGRFGLRATLQTPQRPFLPSFPATYSSRGWTITWELRGTASLPVPSRARDYLSWAQL